MKYFNRGLLFVVLICHLAIALILGYKPASTYDVAFFSWLAYCAIAEKMESMK